MTDKPQLVKLDPAHLEEELAGPVLRSLVEKGWTVGAPLILDDPRRGEHDRIRIGLVMLPPHPGRGGAEVDPTLRRLAIAAVAGCWASAAFAACGLIAFLWG